jgi:hypothetical protein
MARVKHINAYIWQKKSPKTQVPAKQETMLNLKFESKFHLCVRRECSNFIHFSRVDHLIYG